MATTTLTIPAEHAEAWRDAVLVELRSDAKGLISNVETVQREVLTDRARLERARVLEEETDPPRIPDVADLLWPEKVLADDFEILRQSFAAPAYTALEVTAHTDALAHVCETMACRIVPPKISDVTCTSPYSGEVKAEIGEVVEALTWAANEASRLQALWAKQFEAEREAVA